MKAVLSAGTDFNRRLENLCFVSGLICSGAVLMGTGYETIIPVSSVSLGRTVAAALLVEFGARAQNGCTSGHGICGLSRLSVRSAAAVGELLFLRLKKANSASVLLLTSALAGVFMAAGFASASCMHTASSLGVDSVNLTPLPFQWNFPFEYRVSGVSLLALALCTLAAHMKFMPSFLPYPLEVVSGFSFGCGLFLSGMTNPAKVASFLTLSPTLFDPTLMFVMAGGIAVALPGFQFMMRQQAASPPSLSFLDRTIDIPSNKTIDWRLASGAVMFGAGWGLLGICPGPAFVSLATLQPRIVEFCLAYVASFVFFEHVQPLLPKKLHAA